MSPPVLLVAAPSSGAGKTVVTLGLIRALAMRGLKVGSFKVGPDYIDPVFHARASGRLCRNLDSWAMRFETLGASLEAAGRDCDIVVGEGVMGLFDGAPDGTGSTADIASLFGLPVLFVADAARTGQSIAPLIEGFLKAREDVQIVGVVLNRVGSADHEDLLRRACDDRFSTPILGCLRRDPALELPSRHLGLVGASEHPDLEGFLERAAKRVADSVDLAHLRRLARRPNVATIGPPPRPLPALGQRIAVAQDPAFAFAYPAVLEGWRRLGSEVVPFSPLADEAPDREADAVYLPGGYPELYAARLAQNRAFILGLHHAARRGAFVYGECGGYMVLGEILFDKKGERHGMAGLLPVVTSFAEPRLHLGYRQLALKHPCPLGRPPLRYRGHEFHYAAETERKGAPLFAARDARGRDLGETGCVKGNVAGSFYHLIDRAPHLAVVR
ncbi:MAG: cobyrinate a,c-diamide synthase [Geminicoccaceae bacterium]|nr:cobyrinate a,c-diamide synthase [Geminicoccaceae bacterium]